MKIDDPAPSGAGDSASGSVPPAPRDASGAPSRFVTSDSLLAGAAQLAIGHNQDVYFLRQTRFGKLILTK